MTRPHGTMSWSVFQPIADRVLGSQEFDAICFSGMGEPLLNPDLPRFVSYLSGRFPVSVTTNASLLTVDRIQALVEARVNTVIVSFCGHDAELYALMMKGLDFEKANDHVRRLVELGQDKLSIMANVSVTRQTQPYLAQIRQHLQTLGIDEVIFAKCHSRGGYLEDPLICETPMPLLGEGRCDIFDNTLFVAWDGRVLACCHDLEARGALGDLVTEELDQILAKKRRIVQQGVRFPMCDKCNDMYRFADDPTPDDSPLSEWIYRLYSSEQQATNELLAVIRRQEARIRELESVVRGYERGRFIRFTRWLRSIGRRNVNAGQAEP